MTPAALRAVIETQGISQGRLSHLVGVNPRSVRAWLAGEYPAPKSVQALALMLDRGWITPADLDNLMEDCS
jgi:lambda repressor-like predicted transcriptional regulator